MYVCSVLTDEAITVMTERATEKRDPATFMPVFALHGAVTEISDDATAYGGLRTPHYVVDASAVSADAEVFAADRTWVRSVWDALRPLATNAGSYVNFMSEHDERRTRPRVVRTGEVRVARPDQEHLRPGQRVPPQREHQARLIGRT